MKIQKYIIINILVALSFAANAQEVIENSPKKLIVQITIDQFKSDYISRFGSAFEHGFNKIIDDGVVFEKGLVDHAITDSFPGHASLSTGMYPRNHGLSANGWWVLKDEQWQSQYAEEDDDTLIVGSNRRIGSSPKNMTASSIADWVKTQNRLAKAISLSAGTMISMPYGGSSADAIYWLDRPTGRFVSSNFYIDEYPEWINYFNDVTFQNLKTRIWKNEVPEKFRKLAEVDASDYENSGVNNTFPHIFDEEKSTTSTMNELEQFNRWFYNTPMADEALFSLAENAVVNERLGEDHITDYLSIIVNTTDNVGHDFGGRSQEILDTLVRIDRKLGDFLLFLDREIGENNYIVVVSGDHGGPEVIEYQQQKFGTGERISQAQVDNLLDAVENEVIVGAKQGADLVAAIESIMEKYDYIRDAITQREIDNPTQGENPYLELYRKTWIKGRIPAFPLRATRDRPHHPARYGIIAQFEENNTYDAAVVVHASPYIYDREVPIMFYGVDKLLMQIDQSARTIDVAPTLADVAGIKYPSNLDGKSLLKN